MQGNVNANSVELSMTPQKTKDNDHIPDRTNDYHQKAVFCESIKQSDISGTLINPRVKCQIPQA
jgi:hypothetical protein